MAGNDPKPTAQQRQEEEPSSWGILAVIVAAALLALVLLPGGIFWVLNGVIIESSPSPKNLTSTEISHLSQAVELFKQKYGTYPPSKIFLANSQADYANAAAEATKAGDDAAAKLIDNSWLFVNRIFPKMDWSGGSGPIDWTGGRDPKCKGAFLEGDQCLVFFLGGMQTVAAGIDTCVGFAANARNPTLLAGNRLDPYYEFSSRRLVRPEGKGRSHFFVYLNPYDAGKPYVYFSTYGTRNGYQDNDCAAHGITPYFEATGPKRYLNPNTFQILSAGADGDFGPGGLWNPRLQPVDGATRDNQSNFNNGGLMATRQ